MATVLVVDDLGTQRELLTIVLEQFGHQVVGEAENGEEALARYKELKPDLVTMDVNMPKVDGITAARNIFRHDARAKIIMITSHDENNVKYDIVGDVGVVDFLVKPLDPDALEPVLARLGT